MTSTARIAAVAAQLGHPARTAMLVALMDGRALTAGELADAAGIAAPTASGHLAQLADAGLLAPERQGRHRYFRVASPAVAAMIEGMMAVAADPALLPRPVRTGPRDPAMRLARPCYDHLAGRVAVAIPDRMAARGHLDVTPDGAMLTDDGGAFLAALGIAPPADRPQRPLCRTCLDWSERRAHLGGWLGMAMLARFRGDGWLRPRPGSRSLAVTPAGALAFDRHFGIDVADLKD